MSKDNPQNYLGNQEHVWEQVLKGNDGGHLVHRLRVPGGWLYRDGRSQAMCFVPMPEVVKHAV